MQLHSSPFESFTWLNQFIKTVPEIIRGNHVNFRCEPYVTNPEVLNGISHEKARGSSPTLNYTNGMYCLGFYYSLRNEKANIAMPWFGCQFVDEFTIDIIVHPYITAQEANNKRLHHYLLQEYAGGIKQPPIIHGTSQKPFCCQRNGNPKYLLRYRFDDYMRNVQCESNFSLSNWMCSSITQKDDLREFFETVNAKHLAPHI